MNAPPASHQQPAMRMYPLKPQNVPTMAPPPPAAGGFTDGYGTGAGYGIGYPPTAGYPPPSPAHPPGTFVYFLTLST